MSYIDVINTQTKETDSGSAVALVRCTGNIGDTEHYLVSCFHLFGLLANNIEQPCQQATIKHAGKVIASYTGICGNIAPLGTDTWSFDVAFAKVEPQNLELARNAIPGPVPTKILYYMDELPKTAIMHSPRGKVTAPKNTASAISLSNVCAKRGNQQIVSYGPELNRIQAVHRLIASYDGETKRGDSGSPVLSSDGKTLLGMHIAGDGNKGYMLPAVDFIQNANRFIPKFKNDTLSLDL
ncbi:conserved hypothetical protein [Alteromonas sp. 38]|uniref:hypothetical protein n=1 Tax=Alteromonas TaxID=226 RepID=UPI0012F1D92B|nr:MULTISPECIES: hypothetical protein [Alteromonas]CAD5260899.1 conserved hypothetical protein [Alteromonas sp. 154]VXC30524.1 conserved hypothetical protein [Alteromonas sp. 38]